jgi:hypothetical protein
VCGPIRSPVQVIRLAAPLLSPILTGCINVTVTYVLLHKQQLGTGANAFNLHNFVISDTLIFNKVFIRSDLKRRPKSTWFSSDSSGMGESTVTLSCSSIGSSSILGLPYGAGMALLL